MTFTRAHIKIVSAVVLLTAFLTWFFYTHEKLPKPIRSVTALIETPVAIASGISHYLNLGIPVYETAWAIVLTNFVFSVLIVLVINKYRNRRQRN
jgi:ABC-type amino acid transport system permease subunit